MAEYLVVVESPAKAKTIKKFLGKGYKIEASMGHVRDLPKSQIGVDVDKNFEPKYITIRGKGDLIAKLKKEAKAADKIFLATDPDREGEAISWHLANLLSIDDTTKCRISFNEITKNAISEAIKKPRPIDMNLVDAQQARRVLDRIVGYKISPLLWKKIRKGLSAGRVQSVAMRIICDREKEIEAFVSEEYWSITAKLSKLKETDTFLSKFHGTVSKKIELTNEKQVNEILEKIGSNKFIVQKIKKGEKSKNPPPPFITSTLQQEASRKLRFTTKKTMLVAQQLYEGVDIKGEGSVGLVSYIRTDSTRISTEAQSEARNLIKTKFGEKYLPATPRFYKNKSSSQDAHEAIRPTYVSRDPESLKSSLTPEQYKLYKLIWERFIASQMSSATYDTVSVDIGVAEYIFKSSGQQITFRGFTAVYIEGKDEEIDDGNAKIPELVEGEELKLRKVEPKQHFTEPPPRFTEATLVKIMEEKGIGRPSTYAPTITTILARSYVIKEQRFLKPTDLGKIVNDVMVNHFKDIVDLGFTADMEEKLDGIEEGQRQWNDLMKEFYDNFKFVIEEADNAIGRIEVPAEVTDILCEKCGRNMVIKIGRFGKFLACPGFPACRNAKPIFEDAGVACPKCGAKVLIKKTKRGRKYYSCEKNPECEFMSWDKPGEEPKTKSKTKTSAKAKTKKRGKK